MSNLQDFALASDKRGDNIFQRATYRCNTLEVLKNKKNWGYPFDFSRLNKMVDLYHNYIYTFLP